MSVLPDYVYMAADGHSGVTIRATGALADQPENARNYSKSLHTVLLQHVREQPTTACVLLGVVVPPAGVAASYGRLALAEALTELCKMAVAPLTYTFETPLPVLADKPRGHSFWIISWPALGSDELDKIRPVLDRRGLLTTVAFERNDQNVWLMRTVVQPALEQAENAKTAEHVT